MDKEFLQKLIVSMDYKGCKNCKYQISPLRMCEWAEQGGDGQVHFICPKWNKKVVTNIINGEETMNNIIDEIIRQQTEYKERALAEIITKYDFVVGSIECKYRLMEILPEGANIICSPYITDPTMIYAIKKFDIRDLLK
jgi:hypothetical protein